MDALVSAQISAWHQWRSMLHSGQLVPCIRDPDKGVILELDKGGWAGPQGLGPRCSIDDFICPNDPIQPGPLAAIGSKLRPVFFMKDAFAAALAEMSGLVVASRGRRGPKPRYDREFIRRLVCELMDRHRDFSESNSKWRAQADLERAVIEALEKQGLEPATSTVRKLIAAPLREWRASRARR
jgi:hypothetical protein